MFSSCDDVLSPWDGRSRFQSRDEDLPGHPPEVAAELGKFLCRSEGVSEFSSGHVENRSNDEAAYLSRKPTPVWRQHFLLSRSHAAGR